MGELVRKYVVSPWLIKWVIKVDEEACGRWLIEWMIQDAVMQFLGCEEDDSVMFWRWSGDVVRSLQGWFKYVIAYVCLTIRKIGNNINFRLIQKEFVCDDDDSRCLIILKGHWTILDILV